MGGAIEESQKGNSSIFVLFPIMILAMLTLLMIQMQSFSRLAMVFFTAPLGIVGASIALNLAGKPFGFVALLGLIALAGMEAIGDVLPRLPVRLLGGAGQASVRSQGRCFEVEVGCGGGIRQRRPRLVPWFVPAYAHGVPSLSRQTLPVGRF